MTLRTNATTAPAPRFYRFRSTDALLGDRQELAKRMIFFAGPDALNDPLEGFKDIVWRGDELAWRNHLRHYVLCLLQSVRTVEVMGPQFDPLSIDHSRMTSDRLPDDGSRARFDSICQEFFSDSRVAAYPAKLASRSDVRRDEFQFYLWTLHGTALRAILNGLLSDGVRVPGIDGLADTWGGEPLDGAHFENLRDVIEATPDSDAATIIYSATRTLMDQQEILTEPLQAKLGKAWRALLFDYPSAYVDRLSGLLHPPWYAACFVDNFRHPAMWGNYADSHKGVCLEFRTERNSAGTPVLPLNQHNGWSTSGGVIEPIQELVSKPFYPVEYTDDCPELDFFSSLGRLTASDLPFWFQDENDQRSSAGEPLYSTTDAWRDQYWLRHFAAVTRKQAGWSHEGEQRLLLTSVLNDFRDPDSRKLIYERRSLAGVIFGLRTPPTAKAEIVKILRESGPKSGELGVTFYQAYYSRGTGRIERAKLTL